LDERFDDALAVLDSAVTKDPALFWAHHFRGVCLLKRDRPIEATADFSACIALAPTAAWCYYNRGLAFRAAHQGTAAMADFDQCLILDPGFTRADKARDELRQNPPKK
jgi:lipoprotein NlpI